MWKQYLELIESESTASTLLGVVLECRASHNRTDASTSRTRSNLLGLGLALQVATLLASCLVKVAADESTKRPDGVVPVLAEVLVGQHVVSSFCHVV